MGSAAVDVQCVGIKLFVDGEVRLRVADVVPVFHRWIQTQAVDGMLIDVADYEHVQGGPGVVLVAHEGNYSLQTSGARPGMSYVRKQPADGSLAERLLRIARVTVNACRLLEEEPALAGQVKFRGDEVELVANDRLLAPNSDETLAALRPALDALLGKLYDGGSCDVVRSGGEKDRFKLKIKARAPVAPTVLAERLGA